MSEPISVYESQLDTIKDFIVGVSEENQRGSIYQSAMAVRNGQRSRGK